MLRKASALKAHRTSLRRRQINRRRERAVDQLVRAWRQADTKGQSALWPKLQKAIDKAAARRVLHRRAAARMKSRLAKKT